MKQEIIKAVSKFGNLVAKNSPHIFTGIAVTGVIGTIVLMARAQMKADKIVEEEDARRINAAEEDDEEYTPVTFKDRVKLTWKEYILPAVSGATTITAIVLSDTTNTKRLAAVSALYAAAQKTIEEKDSIVNSIADKKTLKAINHEENRKYLENIPDDSAIIQTRGGHQLFVDKLTGQYFYSDADTIMRQLTCYNRNAVYDSLIPASTWLEEYLDLKEAEFGQYLGWRSDEELVIEITYEHISDINQNPIGIVSYKTKPHLIYQDW